MPYTVFFDEECVLCNSAMQWIFKQDKKKKFVFASLQSEYGKNFLRKNTLSADTLYVQADRNILSKSNAILFILKHASYPAKLLYLFTFLPRALRDTVYEWIAKNRYSFFGKQSVCAPSPEMQARLRGS